MNGRILCGYDGSAAAEKSFEYALTLAAAFSAELCVLAVAQPPEPPEDVETEALLESAQARFDGNSPRFGRRLRPPARRHDSRSRPAILPSKSSTTRIAGRPTTSCSGTAERTCSGAG